LIAEISAILGTLNAVNSAVSTIKQTGDNASQLGQALNRLGVASRAIDKVKQQKQNGAILTLQEATQLALAEKQLKDYERDLKDLCYISGNADLYNRMKQLQADSKKAQEDKKIAERKRRVKRAQTFEEITLAVSIVFLIVVLTGIFGFIYLSLTGRIS
jgi:methylphosphotriester-DNA--protein-cysteine methyltransferase|tara:strand:+ start:283 stop:759 length:477 start_codon:yes stop_codon:yes gene_type:complete